MLPNNVPNLSPHKILQSHVDLYYQTLSTKIDLNKSCTLLKKEFQAAKCKCHIQTLLPILKSRWSTCSSNCL